MTDLKFTPPETFPAHYITRDGRKVELLRRIRRDDDYVYIGVMVAENGYEEVFFWTEVGQYLPRSPSSSDLQDIPQRREAWVNVYSNGPRSGHDTKTRANSVGGDRIALWRIRYDEDGGNPDITVEWKKEADE